MRTLLLATTAATLPLAFAGKTPEAPAVPPVPPVAPVATTTSTKRVAPEITAVTSNVPMPVRTSNRGSKTLYPFDSLSAVGSSFGIKDRTARSMNAIIHNANKKNREVKKVDGNVVFKMKDGVATSDPEMVQTQHFFATDVDPKTDPDGASVRIFRDK